MESGSTNRADTFAEHEKVLSAIRDALGDATFNEALAEVRVMEREQALSYALDQNGRA